MKSKKNAFWAGVIIIAITCTLLILAEAIAAVALYQRHRTERDPSFALARAAALVSRRLWSKPLPEEDKFTKVMNLRKLQKDVYPNYRFDPQLHILQTAYHLAQPIESTIVYGNENNFWTVYRTDEIGFRNPLGQQGKSVDFVFIGDSFTQGCCVQDQDTFAGIFRAAGLDVLNLGRSGSGPLSELAVLREYGSYVSPKSVIWYVFLGNDLRNLREEKTTRLSAYIEDEKFSQRLLERRLEISAELKKFLDDQVVSAQERRRLGIPDPYLHDYGETLDVIEAKKEIVLLSKIAESILEYCRRRSIELKMVLIEHPKYHYDLQDITRDALIDFANGAGVPHFLISRNELAQHPDFYALTGPHFSPRGYRWVATKVLQWIKLPSRVLPTISRVQ